MSKSTSRTTKLRWITMLMLAFVFMIVSACGDTITEPSPVPGSGGNGGTGQQPSPALGEDDLPPIEEPTEPAVSRTVTLYFSDNELMEMYRVELEVTVEHEADLPKAALERWLQGPDIEGLTGLAPPEVVLEFVRDNGMTAEVSFSAELRNANLGSSGEDMLMRQVALIMAQFGYPQTQIMIEGEIEESVLGHVYTAEPIVAEDPETYAWHAGEIG